MNLGGSKKIQLPLWPVFGLGALVLIVMAVLGTLVATRSQPSDAGLIARHQMGDQEATAELHKRYGGPMELGRAILEAEAKAKEATAQAEENSLAPLPKIKGLALPQTYSTATLHPENPAEAVASALLFFSEGKEQDATQLFWGALNLEEQQPFPSIRQVEVYSIEDGRKDFRNALGLEKIPQEAIYKVSFRTHPPVPEVGDSLLVRNRDGWKIWTSDME